MFIMASVIQDDGLTFNEVLQNLPHDPAALVVYVLLLAFVGMIWHGSRQKTQD